jgi:copper transport protein
VRRAAIALAVCLLGLIVPAVAQAHPYIVSTTPSPKALLAVSPDKVTITFNEAVELLHDTDADVVNSKGEPVAAGPASNKADARAVVIPLRPNLPADTYTVRWKVIGGDSHVVGGNQVFGVGVTAVGEPYLGGAGSTGPSETGPWGVSSRFLEMLGLGGLLGLLAFRWLVWGPVLRRIPRDADERTAALTWGRDSFWVGFGVLAVGAMLAEGYLLVVQSASVLGTSVWGALGNATGISQVLGNTRFGSLVQLRGALLFGLFALGAIQFIREYGSAGSPRAPSATGSRPVAIAMACLLMAVLGGIAAQGHASVDDLSWLQVGAQLVHVAAVSVWIAGLALVALVHLRLPKIAPGEGPAVAAATLARFSKVALLAVGVAVATGVVRSLGELSDVTQLWETAYGRSILIKIALLAPIFLIALYNRKIVVALRRVSRPNRPTLALVRRTASAELVLSLVIVVVASLLVAQVPAGA